MIPIWDLPPPLVQLSPPLALFVRGDAAIVRAEAAAIVGSRAASVEAALWARARAAELAGRGIVVVSGGAEGIDAAAHLGAIEAGGRTVAYLGVPADEIYPRRHRRLFERIIAGGGALISEYGPGEDVAAYGHSRRNRFIAAHGASLIVAEAAVRSGTLATVSYAERLGRPILVSPPGVGRLRGGLDLLTEQGRATVFAS